MKYSNASTTSGDESLRDFADRVTKLMPRLIHAMQQQEQNALSSGVVTLPQYVVLDRLFDRGLSRMNDLSEHLGMKPSHVTGVMDRLVALGMVRRTDSAQDRRLVLAELTDKGKRAVRQIRAEKRDSVCQVYECLTVEEREVYVRAVEKLLQSMGEENAIKPPESGT